MPTISPLLSHLVKTTIVRKDSDKPVVSDTNQRTQATASKEFLSLICIWNWIYSCFSSSNTQDSNPLGDKEVTQEQSDVGVENQTGGGSGGPVADAYVKTISKMRLATVQKINGKAELVRFNENRDGLEIALCDGEGNLLYDQNGEFQFVSQEIFENQ